MSKFSHTQLFLLAIVSVLLLLFTFVDCNNYNDRLESTLLARRLYLQDPFYNGAIEQDKSSEEEMDLVARNLFKSYPNRRSFYAMRGKRRAILP
jgi:hypothetical protein